MTVAAILTRVLAQARTLAHELGASDLLERLDELERQPVSPFLDEQVIALREVGTLVDELRLRLEEGTAPPSALPAAGGDDRRAEEG